MGGVSPSHPTMGSGEHCELPQRGPWRSIDAKRILCILMPSRGRWLQRFTEFGSVSSNAELCKLHKHRQDTKLMLRYSPLYEQEAQLMLTTGSTRLAVSRGQQTWYHSTCYI